MIGRAVVLSFVLFFSACGVWSSSVRARAFLLETQPQDGAVLTAPPSETRLTFNEPVAVLAAEVVTLEGDRVTPPVAWTSEGAMNRPGFAGGQTV